MNDFHQSASFLIKVKLVKIAKTEMSMVERNGFLGNLKNSKWRAVSPKGAGWKRARDKSRSHNF